MLYDLRTMMGDFQAAAVILMVIGVLAIICLPLFFLMLLGKENHKGREERYKRPARQISKWEKNMANEAIKEGIKHG